MVKEVLLPLSGEMFSTHFGRADSFALYKVENEKILEKNILPTPAHVEGSFPDWVKSQGFNTVIVGGMGPKAISRFEGSGIEIITGVTESSPDKIIEDYVNGKLNVDSEFNTRLHADHNHEKGGNCKH